MALCRPHTAGLERCLQELGPEAVKAGGETLPWSRGQVAATPS